MEGKFLLTLETSHGQVQGAGKLLAYAEYRKLAARSFCSIFPARHLQAPGLGAQAGG